MGRKPPSPFARTLDKSKLNRTAPNYAKQIQIEPNSIGDDSILSKGYGDQSVKSAALPNSEWVAWPATVFLTVNISSISDLHNILRDSCRRDF
jgi:hypothetical protein